MFVDWRGCIQPFTDGIPKFTMGTQQTHSNYYEKRKSDKMKGKEIKHSIMSPRVDCIRNFRLPRY